MFTVTDAGAIIGLNWRFLTKWFKIIILNYFIFIHLLAFPASSKNKILKIRRICGQIVNFFFTFFALNKCPQSPSSTDNMTSFTIDITQIISFLLLNLDKVHACPNIIIKIYSLK